ncbi:MarC family protein, partial [Salmonella enterica subsp. enterica serovar Kentucky]|nr:MarC family protein [Salmonella enterica subsp. enterica serovar Kentucky]
MRLILPYRASRKSSGDYQGICVRKGIISVAVLLILIMDQRRNLPAFMRVLKHGEAKCRWAIAMHTSIKKPGSDYAL